MSDGPNDLSVAGYAIVKDVAASTAFDYSDGLRHVCRCGRPYRSEPKEWCPDMSLHHQHDDACCGPTFEHYGYSIVKIGDVPPWMERWPTVRDGPLYRLRPHEND